MIHTNIHGHTCGCWVLARHGAGTIDVEVIECGTCPGLVGKCFRVSGLPLESAR
jgi:hypothetical protein